MLELNQLSVMTTDRQYLLDGVSLTIESGTITGLTGESGAGKSTILKSILGILSRQARIVSGNIVMDGMVLSELSARAHRQLCGTTIGFIPQNPMTAFDSRLPLGKQTAETLRLRKHLTTAEAEHMMLSLLADLGITDPLRMYHSYPGQLSGGMLQRAVIALLLALKPAYILADEPTSALDTENRDLLLKRLSAEKAGAGILFISHDVAALTALCDQVHVMEHGRITESAPIRQLLARPQQAWTKQFAAAAAFADKEVFTWTEY